MFGIKKELIIITTTLNLKLLKNNNLKISKNNIAYSTDFDKIVFEIDGTFYYLINNKNNLQFHKEDKEYIFDIQIGLENRAKLNLKEANTSFDIEVINGQYKVSDNNIIIEYLLSTDEEQTRIEIEL
jgi:hypothetical protein